MNKEIIWNEPGRARGRWPLGVRVGQYLFLSAMLPTDPSSGRLVSRQVHLPGDAPRLATGSLLADGIEERMSAQSWFLYQRIDEVLRSLGSGKNDILLLNGWLADFREWPALNRVRGASFPEQWFPPSTTFGVPDLSMDGARVTFETIALSSQGGDIRKESVGSNVQVGNYFPGAKAGPFIFLAGDVATDPETGHIVHSYADLDEEGRKLATGRVGPDGWEGPIRAQTWFIYQRLARLLESAGASLRNVVKQSIYIKDPRDYPACEGIMRMVYGDQLPPTTAVRVDEYGNRAFIVEVELTVAMPGQVGSQRIAESAVPTLGPGYPIGVRADPFLFLSGLHPLRADGSLVDEGEGRISRLAERQAEQIYANLGTILGEQGAGLNATVRQVIYVADRGLIPVVERVAAAAFGESPPATTFVPLPGLWPSPTLVQVDATATI